MKLRRKILNAILNFEKWVLEEGTPEHWEPVDYKFIYKKLTEDFPSAKIYLSDRCYYLPSLQDVFDFLDGDETDKERYISELHDCDDFSFRLMGQFHAKPWSMSAFGIAWSQIHAYNIVVTIEGLFLVEPQTDAVFKPDDNPMFKTELIII